MSFKSGAAAGRILKGRLVSLPRSGHYPCTERGSTPAPNGTVPLFRARCTTTPRAIRAVSIARYEMLVPSGAAPLSRARCTTTPRAEGTSHSERGLSAHSFGWDIHTRPSGTHPLARVGHAHQPERHLHTEVV